MLVSPFLSKLQSIKSVEKQYKTIERILFHVFNIMGTKKTQAVSSKLLVLAREISDFMPMITSAFRSFPSFFNLDFPHLLDTQGKMLFPSHPFFVAPILFSCLGCNCCIWNWLKGLNMKLLPLVKNGKYTNWFGLFHFHNYLKWDNFCRYKWKFKFQKVEWNVYSVEKSICFHFQSFLFPIGKR